MLVLVSLFLVFGISAAKKPGYCKKQFKRPFIGKYCPSVPVRNKKGNKKCFAAARIDLNRHTAGYKSYFLKSVDEASAFVEKSTQTKVDMTLLMSVLAKESWFNPVIKNKWGDRGVAQFQQATAQATLDYIAELGISFETKVNDNLPPKCKTGSYSDKLSKACFSSLKKNCSTKKYRASLYCPAFALKLMAFHFQQIQARDVMIEHDGKQYNVRELLVRNGDDESDVRHLASVYNRGFRIYNSAYQNFLATKSWMTAKRYGKVWATKREVAADKDPFEGGTLSGHFINRCYVWGISGLCGGMKGSLIEDYSREICSKPSGLHLLSAYEGDTNLTTTVLPIDIAEKVEELERLKKADILSRLMQLKSYKQPNRALNLKLIKAVAKRKWLSDPTAKNSDWLFMAAAAGYYRSSGGHTEIEKYTKICVGSSACHHLKVVLKMQKRLKQMNPDRSYRETMVLN